MEKPGVTPVQIIQELMAILTIRKEACERMLKMPVNGVPEATLHSIVSQTELSIKELQEELSTFGDAVMAEIDRNNEYHAAWKKALEDEKISADELWRDFNGMEDILKHIYADYNASTESLADSLKELLNRQAERLPKTR